MTFRQLLTHNRKMKMMLKVNMQKPKLAMCFSHLPIFIKPHGIREVTVLVHGGAGTITDGAAERKSLGVQMAANEAFLSLKETGNVLDAVERAIKIMEADEIFNAGYGSYLTATGDVEMDASIMHGAELSAAGVSAVRDIKHPITLAKLVLTKTSNVMLAGDGAMKFAREQGVKILPPGSLVSKMSRKHWELTKTPGGLESGTVGAVVMDKDGNLAAGTSTGGINRKLPGRCSDSCAIGAGTYADNTLGAVSCSGDAEGISRMCLAFAIANKLSAMSATEAIQTKLMAMYERLKAHAGAITITKSGDIGIAFNTKRMAWAYQRGRTLCYGMKPDEHHETKI